MVLTEDKRIPRIPPEHLDMIARFLMSAETSFHINGRLFMAMCLNTGCNGIEGHRKLQRSQFEWFASATGSRLLKFTPLPNHSGSDGGANNAPAPEPYTIPPNDANPAFCLHQAIDRFDQENRAAGMSNSSIYMKRDCIPKNESHMFRNALPYPGLYQGPDGVIYMSGFTCGATAKSKVGQFMQEICQAAGLPLTYTIHSGRATYITNSLDAGVPVLELMKRTGRKERSIACYMRMEDPTWQAAFHLAMQHNMLGTHMHIVQARQIILARARAADLNPAAVPHQQPVAASSSGLPAPGGPSRPSAAAGPATTMQAPPPTIPNRHHQAQGGPSIPIAAGPTSTLQAPPAAFPNSHHSMPAPPTSTAASALNFRKFGTRPAQPATSSSARSAAPAPGVLHGAAAREMVDENHPKRPLLRAASATPGTASNHMPQPQRSDAPRRPQDFHSLLKDISNIPLPPPIAGASAAEMAALV